MRSRVGASCDFRVVSVRSFDRSSDRSSDYVKYSCMYRRRSISANMAPKRSTFQGSPRDVAEALKAVAKSPDFVKLPARLESRHQRQKRIGLSSGAMIAIRNLQENMSIPRKCMESALGMIADDNTTWTLDDRDKWIKRTCATLRNNCRFVQQARTKNKDAGWVKQFFEGTLVATCVEHPTELIHASSSEEPAFEISVPTTSSSPHVSTATPVTPTIREKGLAPRPPEYVYGWQLEHRRAWRAELIKGKPKSRLFTKDIHVNPEGGADAPVIAKWPDGHTAPIEEMPASLYNAREEASKADGGVRKRPACAIAKMPASLDDACEEAAHADETGADEEHHEGMINFSSHRRAQMVHS